MKADYRLRFCAVPADMSSPDGPGPAQPASLSCDAGIRASGASLRHSIRFCRETTVPWPGLLFIVTSSTQARMIAMPRPDSGSFAIARSLASRLGTVIRLRSLAVAEDPGAGLAGWRRSLAAGPTDRLILATGLVERLIRRRRLDHRGGSRPRPPSTISSRHRVLPT